MHFQLDLFNKQPNNHSYNKLEEVPYENTIYASPVSFSSIYATGSGPTGRNIRLLAT
jgi:hypothetical protein